MSGIHQMLFTGDSALAASLQSSMLAEDIRTSGTAAAGVQFFNDGTYNTYGNGGSNTPPSSPRATWKTGGGTASDYEIRMTVVTGGFNVGAATGSWLSLGTDRTWGQSRSTSGTASGTGTLEIRRVSDGTVLASTAVGGVDIAAAIEP